MRVKRGIRQELEGRLRCRMDLRLASLTGLPARCRHRYRYAPYSIVDIRHALERGYVDEVEKARRGG
jgi:hypothetical protein